MDRPLLNKATSADATPTPGYMYAEIVKITYAGAQACELLEDYLLKKLPKDNADVKLKCLRILKHVCEKGKPDFKRSIQKKAEVVKACLTYRGQVDPLKGDAPSKAVRDEAEEALKVIFNSSQQNAYGQITSEPAYPAQYSSPGFSSSGNRPAEEPRRPQDFGNSGGGGGKMVGYGNPYFDNQTKEAPTLLQRASDSAWTQISKIGAKLPSSLSRGSAGLSGHSELGDAPLPGGPTTWQPPPMPPSSSAPTWQSPQQQPSNRWGNDSAPRPQSQSQSQAEPSGAYETRIVDDLCAPGGARVALTQVVLDEFCHKCETLDATTVGELLSRKLQEGEWQTKLKALCAIEALVDANLDGITGAICEIGYDALVACKDVPQCRARVVKVMRLLGFEVEATPALAPQGASSVASSPAAPVPPVADLLDFGEPAMDLGGDVLGGMSAAPDVTFVAATPAAPAAAPSVALLPGIGFESAPAVANGNAAGNDMSLLDDMLGGTVFSEPPAAPPGDLLADFSTYPSTAPVQAPLSPQGAQDPFSAGRHTSQSSSLPTQRRDAHLDALSRGSSGYPMGGAPLCGSPLASGNAMMGNSAQPMIGSPTQSMMQNNTAHSMMGNPAQPMGFQAQPMGSPTRPMVGNTAQPMGFQAQPMCSPTHPMVGNTAQPMGSQAQPMGSPTRPMVGNTPQPMGFQAQPMGSPTRPMVGNTAQPMGSQAQPMGSPTRPMVGNTPQPMAGQHMLAAGAMPATFGYEAAAVPQAFSSAKPDAATNNGGSAFTFISSEKPPGDMTSQLDDFSFVQSHMMG